jgi:uncharacterized protein (TIGR02117 family)
LLTRFVKRLGVGLAGVIVLYFTAALIGSFVPRNSDWREPASGTTVYIITNGYHSGLILPVSAEGEDLSLLIRPTDLSNRKLAGNWLLFGWGDRDFYLNTPTLADIKFSTAIHALAGSGQTLVHVDHLQSPDDVVDPRPIRLDAAAYQKLTRFIRASLAIDANGYPVVIAGYNESDVFYEARGRYNLLHSCNNWTSDALAAAGVRTALWSPLSGGVMHWHPAKQK